MLDDRHVAAAVAPQLGRERDAGVAAADHQDVVVPRTSHEHTVFRVP
jgi:hypothetical protein